MKKKLLIGFGALFIFSGIIHIPKDISVGLLTVSIGVLLIFWGLKVKVNQKSESNAIKPQTPSTDDNIATTNDTAVKFKSEAVIMGEQVSEEKMREEKRKLWLQNAMNETQHNVNQLVKTPVIIDKDNALKRKLLKDMPEIKFKNITRSFNKNSLPAFVVVDVETTGLYAHKDRIIELSAIFYENYEPISCFTTLVNPQKPIPKEASDVNGIYDEDVKDAPTISEVSESFLEFVGNCPIVAYNASFDLKFLYCSGIDLISAKNPLYDAYALVRKAYKDNYSYTLLSVANDIGIYYNAHSSLHDCYATGKVFDDAIDEIIYS